ncbi:MAG: hypothetical protein HY000_31150 [Planctomycetes bacterium]|nr:hypothetical protein [Planctomycetota bacterium]
MSVHRPDLEPQGAQFQISQLYAPIRSLLPSSTRVGTILVGQAVSVWVDAFDFDYHPSPSQRFLLFMPA